MAVIVGYTTYKIVRVKDRYLGLLYYASVICIFAYIIYSIFAQELYLKKSPPVAGFVRASAKLDVNLSAPLPSYCNIAPPVSSNNLFKNCLRWTAQQIVFPYDGELKSVFLTTRVTIARTPTPSELSCTDFETACRPPTYGELLVQANTTVSTYYIANIENVTLQVDHGVRVHYDSSLLGLGSRAIPSKEMEGRMLKGCSGNDKDYLSHLNWDQNYRRDKNTSNHLDTFSIRDLLISANCDNTGAMIDLEGPATADGAANGETLRSSGFVVSTPILYQNRGDFRKAEEITYRYIPAQIDGTEFKVLETKYNPDGSLTYLNRHGIRLVFDQAGQIGQFDMIALLTALVAAMALLRIATLIVEVLMLWVMPHRDLYSQAKFESTEDFSDIRDRLSEKVGKDDPKVRTTQPLSGGPDDEPGKRVEDTDIGAAMGQLYGPSKV
ncbi:hypothetical protein SpCBS45565_g03878 [Spizellomyces sp. 'palustris']|nr:hypothetical protein SpCBS45565_g03878 [Spizellomyces sp. 'palustris']